MARRVENLGGSAELDEVLREFEREVLLMSAIAHAHVKWFSKFTYADRPRTVREVLTPTFLALAALVVAFLALRGALIV